MESTMEPRSGSFIADTERAENGNKPRSISNTMGGAIIVLMLSVGGFITYQQQQMDMAIDMLNLIAQDIEAQKKT